MTTTRVRSRKAEQANESRRLRSEGRTWTEIADTFREVYGVNARVALRLARGWSQADAAEHWNKHWPEDQKTFKNISYWEQWPASTGYAPSLDVLARLAELYECQIGDLLRDGPDYSQADAMQQARLDTELLGDLAGNSGSITVNEQFAELTSRLAEADVRELAATMAAWGHQMDASLDRRQLLMKLSFALTVAAASPDGTDPTTPAHKPLGSAADFTGIWKSRYVYRSSGRGEDFEDVHYVVVKQDGAQLAVESLPHTTGSKIGMGLTVDAHSVTGNWEERTSPTGYYKGAVYRGALQMLLSPTGTDMNGKWIGFGKNFKINSGDWDLTLEDRRTTKAALRAYSLKV